MTQPEGALSGVRIIDLTDERAIYGVKLLADLGADVVRPEPPEGDPLRRRGPLRSDGEDTGTASLWHAFFASNRRFFALDPDTESGRTQLALLLENSDIVMFSSGAFATAHIDIETARKTNQSLVSVECSSFGKAGPWKDYLAPDLVAGALGGSVSTTGDVDTPPLKTFGELNFVISGTYVGIAALAALHHAREKGEGQHVHVPVHNCIASCLEHVFMWHWYNHLLPNATAKALERRGSLHWSNAYVVMQAVGGSIMVTPTPDFDAQLAWLIEEGVQDDLIDPKYQELENRRRIRSAHDGDTAPVGGHQGRRGAVFRSPGPSFALRMGVADRESRRQSAAGGPRLVEDLRVDGRSSTGPVSRFDSAKHRGHGRLRRVAGRFRATSSRRSAGRRSNETA